MSGRQTEAERLRLARRIFERAMADNVTMREARQRLSDEAHALAARARQQRADVIDSCGRSAAPMADHTPAQPVPCRVPVPNDDSNDGLKWFQR